MCGIFGGIGKYNKATIRFLAYLNESRGSHAFGFMTDTCIVKDGISVKEYLKKDSSVFKIIDGSPYIAGHTRHATCGDKDNAEHAHPFNKGHITGVHNGMISNTEELKDTLKAKFVVDSEYIFESLNQESDIVSALKILCGGWCLFWKDDRTPEHVYLARHSGMLSYCKTSNCIYFSSDNDHLKIALSPTSDIKDVPYDAYLKINVNTLEVEQFEIKEIKGYSSYGYNKNNDFRGRDNRTYCNGYEDDYVPSVKTQDKIEEDRAATGATPDEVKETGAKQIVDNGSKEGADVGELFSRTEEEITEHKKEKYFTCAYCNEVLPPEKRFGGVIYGESNICIKCATYRLQDELAKL